MIDLYGLLGVKATAKPDEIRAAYRKLAFKYHPDRNKTKDAEKTFRDINQAYEILNDEAKRRGYDDLRTRPFSPPPTSGSGGKAQKSPGVDPSMAAWNNAFHSDLFEQMFNAAQGTTKPKKKGKCAVCKGKKILTVHLGLFVMGMPCPICAIQ
jgi:molecular chaperone DnaJ